MTGFGLWLFSFRACRLFMPAHCHINGLCPRVPAEWETLRNFSGTYRLWLALTDERGEIDHEG
jgi:hypothetical protein